MSEQPGANPTIVVVHGAFADASRWNGVIERLQQQGYTVVVPADPLRGVASDSPHLASVVSQIDGPELLAGHSYGGALITNAATSAGPNGGTADEFFIDPALFRDALAAALPAERTAPMAAAQRPVAAVAFSEASGPPAWRRLPSWAVVATGDKAASSDVIRSMAQRAGVDIGEVEGSHVIMVSQPQAVTDLKAARAVAGSGR
jgi:pimeloyl-ACP methyl ester carboxylesterase